MVFNIKTEKSAEDITKDIGYTIIGQIDLVSVEGVEYTLEKKLTNDDYPQFGLYIRPGSSKGTYDLTLHFHRVRPADELPHDGPAGEYSGLEVEQEADHIRGILQSNE